MKGGVYTASVYIPEIDCQAGCCLRCQSFGACAASAARLLSLSPCGRAQWGGKSLGTCASSAPRPPGRLSCAGRGYPGGSGWRESRGRSNGVRGVFGASGPIVVRLSSPGRYRPETMSRQIDGSDSTPGTYLAAGATAGPTCGRRDQPWTDASGCAASMVGTFSRSDSCGMCEGFPAGRYHASSDWSSCIAFGSVGPYSSTGALACTPCAADELGCETGAYTAAGVPGGTKCAPGYFWGNLGTSGCSSCAPDTERGPVLARLALLGPISPRRAPLPASVALRASTPARQVRLPAATCKE